MRAPGPRGVTRNPASPRDRRTPRRLTFPPPSDPRPRFPIMFRERPRRGKQTFGILPPYDLDTRKTSLRDARLPRRVSRLLVLIMVSMTLLGLYSLLDFEEESWIPSHFPWEERPPPLYSKYHRLEHALPQHNLDLPYPEGKDGKYFWISEHVHGMSHQASSPLQRDFYVRIFLFQQAPDGITPCKNTSSMLCSHTIHEERESPSFS